MHKLWTGADFWGQTSLKMSDIWSRSHQNRPHYSHLFKLTSKYSIHQEVWGRWSIVNTNTVTVAWAQRKSPNNLEEFSNSSTHQNHQEGLWKHRLLDPTHRVLESGSQVNGREFAFLTSSQVELIILDHVFTLHTHSSYIYCGAFQDLALSLLFILLCHSQVTIIHLTISENRFFLNLLRTQMRSPLSIVIQFVPSTLKSSYLSHEIFKDQLKYCFLCQAFSDH